MHGEEIKSLRSQLGVSQEAFAKILRTNYATVCRWETRKTSPSESQKDALNALQGLLSNPDFDRSRLVSVLTSVGIFGTLGLLSGALGAANFLGPLGWLLSGSVVTGQALYKLLMSKPQTKGGGNMPRTYLNDPDLEFLKDASNEDLGTLFEYLAGPEDNRRWTEELTIQEEYKKYGNDYQKYYREIIHELQLFGGNTIMNIARDNQGVPYREILIDACKKLKVNFNENQSIDIIEGQLFFKITNDAVDKMKPEEIDELANELGIKEQMDAKIKKQMVLAAIQGSIRAGRFKAYQVAVVVANAVAKIILGKGLSGVANRALTRYMSILAGPVGWAITAIWTIADVAGPAYRVTIPACIHVAYLRLKATSERMTKYCAAGHPNLLDAKFCSECGLSL